MFVLAAGGLALFLVPLRGVNLSRMNGLGLISALPVESLAGVGLLALAFILALGLPRAHPVMLGLMLAGLVICLDGVTVITEAEPRFPTTYQIAGFTEYISRTGHTAPGIAAYFSWPGFFALVAMVEGMAGTHDLLPVLRLWPPAIDLLCLLPLFLIMRNLSVTWRAKWFAALLFCAGNWVGQDYFSPQAFNYLLYLLFVAILLTWFRPGTHARPAARHPPTDRLTRRLAHLRWREVFESGELPARPASTSERAILLGLLIGLFVVSTASHQLSPFFFLGACGGLVVARRCTLTGLPVLLGVILAGWISFASVAFWSGHLSAMFGGIGHVGANLSTSVSGRMTGSTPEHVLVLYVRAGFAAAVMILAALGFLRRRHQTIDDRAALVLLCVPFLAFGLQSYGGEIALRIYLFALPAACILAACFFFPATRPQGRVWRVLPGAAVCAVVFVLAFFVARYGNEAYEQVPRGELTAADYVYAHDSAGARLVWLSPDPAVDNTPQMPWQYRDIEKVDYIAAQAPRDPANVAGLVATLRSLGPGTYLMTTRTQETYLEQAVSYPPGWGSRFRADMAAAPGVRAAFADRDAVVFAMHWPPGAPTRPLNVSVGGGRSGRPVDPCRAHRPWAPPLDAHDKGVRAGLPSGSASAPADSHAGIAAPACAATPRRGRAFHRTVVTLRRRTCLGIPFHTSTVDRAHQGSAIACDTRAGSAVTRPFRSARRRPGTAGHRAGPPPRSQRHPQPGTPAHHGGRARAGPGCPHTVTRYQRMVLSEHTRGGCQDACPAPCRLAAPADGGHGQETGGACRRRESGAAACRSLSSVLVSWGRRRLPHGIQCSARHRPWPTHSCARSSR